MTPGHQGDDDREEKPKTDEPQDPYQRAQNTQQDNVGSDPVAGAFRDEEDDAYAE